MKARLGTTWDAFSAGTQPAAQVNPHALTALAEVGIETTGSHPKHLGTFIRQPFDAVITVCDDAAENCPVWLGQGKRMHIGFPDPAAVVGDEQTILAAFRQSRDAIAERLLPVLETFSTDTSAGDPA